MREKAQFKKKIVYKLWKIEVSPVVLFLEENMFIIQIVDILTERPHFFLSL